MGLGNGDGLQAMPPADIRTGTAVSGLLLVLFIVVHLLGLIPALVAPDQFEAYATALHASPWLPLVEISLVLMALVHIGLSLSKAIANRQAGNSAQLSSRRQAPLAALASRSTVAAGLLTLVFLAVHLGQLAGPVPPAARKRPCSAPCCINPSMRFSMGWPPSRWACTSSMAPKPPTAAWDG